MVHRDIKPNNIFLTSNNTIKIGDFGLVKSIDKIMSGRKLSMQHFNPNISSTANQTTSSNLSNNNNNGNANICKCYKKSIELNVSDLSEDEDMSEDTNITEKCGTSTYSSPEQLDANLDIFDHRSDIYSLGVVLIQLFSLPKTDME